MNTRQLKETIRIHFVNLKYAVDMKPIFDMIDELDRLATIGLITELAFEKEVFQDLAISGDSFNSVDELVDKTGLQISYTANQKDFEKILRR